MTVCGEKVTGVCVAGKCPYFKRCHPVVWDKYGKSKPKTNEEMLRGYTFEELAGAIYEWYSQGHIEGKVGKQLSPVTRVVEWLKEKHHEM